MKKITSSLAALAVIATIVALSAFKTTSTSTTEKTERRATLWYEYNGGDATQASSYDLMASQPADDEEASNLCPETGQVCVIRATSGSGDHPAAFSSSFQTEINTAISTGNETSNVKLRGN
ncbi:hypothetical protein [Arcticibacter tournemirensis]